MSRAIWAPGCSPRTKGVLSTGSVSCVCPSFRPLFFDSIVGISTVPGSSRVVAVCPTTLSCSSVGMAPSKSSGRLTRVRSSAVIWAPWLTSRSTETKYERCPACTASQAEASAPPTMRRMASPRMSGRDSRVRGSREAAGGRALVVVAM